MSTFACGASLFGALAAGCVTAFAVGTAFCRSLFLATVAQVLFTGSTGTAGIFMLLASGALWKGFVGRGGRTGGIVAGPVAMYCAMVARRQILMESTNGLFDLLVKGRRVASTPEMMAEEVWMIPQSHGGRRLVEGFSQQFQLTQSCQYQAQ